MSNLNVKLINNMKSSFKNLFKPNQWGLVRVIRDIENYVDWIKTIDKEKVLPKSKFNNFKLQHNWFYTVYTILSLEDTDYALPEEVKKIKVLEMTNPLNLYFDEELGFAECLVPEIFNFFDEKNQQTLSYMIAYRFAFNKLSITWLVKWFVILSTIVFIGIKFDWFSKLYACLMGLI